MNTSTHDDTTWTLHPTMPGVRLSRDGRVQTCWNKVYPNRKLGGGECMRMTEKWREAVRCLNRQLRRYYVSLYGSRGSKPRAYRSYALSCLLMETFVGPRPPGCFVCHNNGDATDNRLENLRYDTPKGNSDDTLLHGTRARGSKHGVAKLTEEQVAEIRKLLFEGHSLSSIGRRFGVTYVTVLYIRDGKTWGHVPPYTPAPVAC